MATPTQAGYERRGYLGTILVTLGSVALVADLQVLAPPLARLAERLHGGVFSLLPSLGLSFLNAARALAFHQIDYFSLVSRILILFTAAVAVVVGLALLRSRSEYPLGANRTNASTFRERETRNG
jgi:hypothetical protein